MGEKTKRQRRQEKTGQNRRQSVLHNLFFSFFLNDLPEDRRKTKDRAATRKKMLYTSRLKDTRKKNKKKKGLARFSYLTFYIVFIFYLPPSSTESTVLDNRSMYVRAK